MLAPSLIPIVLAVALLMIPGSSLEALGAESAWERDLLRFTGVFLAFHGLVTLSAYHVRGIGHADPVLSRASTAALVIMVLYALHGNGLFLLLGFSTVMGMSLNRAMKRLELAYERAQLRVDPEGRASG